MTKVKIEVIVDADLPEGDDSGIVNSTIERVYRGNILVSKRSKVVNVYGIPPQPLELHRIPSWMKKVINRMYGSNL